MPIIRTPLSPLGQYLVPGIKNMLVQNANAMIDAASVEEGCEALANAISYGIAHALGSPQFLASLSSGVGVSAGPAQVASLTPLVSQDIP
jgi:hypothetical protein